MENLNKSFRDKQNRLIIIEDGSGDEGMILIGKHENIEIAKFDFSISDDGLVMLTHCIINKNYQRAGIGIKLIEIAESWHSNFAIVSHLSEEGASFLNYCNNEVFKYDHDSVDDERF